MAARRFNLAARTPAFTLIELLVVISIIAVLISILLPGLQRARDQSKTVVCRSNMKQIVNAVLMYTHDNRDLVMPVNQNLSTTFAAEGAAWARVRTPAGVVKPGLIFDYITTVDRVFECPSNRRTSSTREWGSNMFGGNSPLDFDYTMAANVQGASTSRTIRMAYVAPPERWAVGTLPPISFPLIASLPDLHIKPLSGMPVFVEENTLFYNEGVPDGLWSNGDQVEVRHRRTGHMGFLQGHVEEFKPPMGKFDKVREAEDLEANDFYVRTETQWVRMEFAVGTMRPYGWINTPKP